MVNFCLGAVVVKKKTQTAYLFLQCSQAATWTEDSELEFEKKIQTQSQISLISNQV